MSKRYINHYRILGLRQEAGWLELRQAYKSLVNIWHPDRFQQDARQKQVAEEKTKEITQSYKELAEYYRTYGALPHALRAPQRTAPENVVAPSAEDFPDIPLEHETPYSEPVPDDAPTSAETHSEGQPRFTSRAITVAALAFAVYFLAQLLPSDAPQQRHQQENRSEPAVDVKRETEVTPPAETEPADDTDNDKHRLFTVGASLGEVYSIQGVPTKTEPDVWYYGKSKVFFAKGKVVRWEQNPDNPLRAALNPGENKIHAIFIGKGSTKAQVLAIQGAPDRDAGDVWDYGTSRIYFDDGHVKGWDESPFNPLKVHR